MQGFFGYASNAIIKNVGLENVDISCKEDSAGLLAGSDDPSSYMSYSCLLYTSRCV